MDLSNLSMAQLRDLQSQVADQIKNRQAEEVAKVRAQITELAQSVGMTVEAIMNVKGGAAKKSANPVAVRYQHPAKPELTWTGRGRQPRWIKEYLEETKKEIDTLRV